MERNALHASVVLCCNVEPTHNATLQTLQYTTADVKNKRSGQKTGKKITGMQFLAADTTKLLITSNDSRIRLYDGEAPCCKQPQ